MLTQDSRLAKIMRPRGKTCVPIRVILRFRALCVAYQIEGDDEQNKMQVTFSSKGQTGDLWARSKGQISFTCQFQRFLYQTLFSQIKDRKHIEQNFHSVAMVMPRVGTVGAWGVKNFSVGICDGAPLTARSSSILHLSCRMSDLQFSLVLLTHALVH